MLTLLLARSIVQVVKPCCQRMNLSFQCCPRQPQSSPAWRQRVHVLATPILSPGLEDNVLVGLENDLILAKSNFAYHDDRMIMKAVCLHVSRRWTLAAYALYA